MCVCVCLKKQKKQKTQKTSLLNGPFHSPQNFQCLFCKCSAVLSLPAFLPSSYV